METSEALGSACSGAESHVLSTCFMGSPASRYTRMQPSDSVSASRRAAPRAACSFFPARWRATTCSAIHSMVGSLSAGRSRCSLKRSRIWTAWVLYQAVHLLDRLGVRLFRQKDPRQQQRLPVTQGVPGLRGERGPCCPLRRLSQIAACQPQTHAGPYHPGSMLGKTFLLNQGFELLQGHLCGRKIPSCQREPC